MIRFRPSMIPHRRRGSATILCILMMSFMMLPIACGSCALVLVFEWKRPWITFVISPDTTKLNLDDDILSLPNPPRNKLYLPYCWGCTQYSYNLSSKTTSTNNNNNVIASQLIPVDTELKEENNLTDQCPAEHTFLPIEEDRSEVVDVSPQHNIIDEELLLALIIISGTHTPIRQHNSRVNEDSPPSYYNLYSQQVFLLSVLLLCVAAIMINNLNEGEGVSNDNITAMKRNLEVETDLDSNDNVNNDEEEEEDDTPRAVDPPASNPLEHVLKVLNIGNDNNKKDKKVVDKKNENIKKEKDKMKKDIKKIKRRSTIASCDSTADYPLKENQPLATREEDRQPAGRRRPTLVKRQTSQKVYGKGEKLLQVV